MNWADVQAGDVVIVSRAASMWRGAIMAIGNGEFTMADGRGVYGEWKLLAHSRPAAPEDLPKYQSAKREAANGKREKLLGYLQSMPGPHALPDLALFVKLSLSRTVAYLALLKEEGKVWQPGIGKYEASEKGKVKSEKGQGEKEVARS